MKVMVIVKATKDSEAGVMPSTEMLTAMTQYNEELARAGVMVDGAGLTPSSQGARVRFSGKTRTVVDGPFAETKELIAGYWVWKVKSLQEAIDWVKKCPNPMNEDSDIEIRPYFELADFGDAMTPELKEQEAAVMALTLGLNRPTFRDHGAMIVAGLNAHYTMETRTKIPQQWEQFVPRMHSLPSVGTDCYGVCWSMSPDCGFDYLTGVEVASSDKLPADFKAVTIAPQRYAVFEHTKHVSAIPQTIDTIWTKWVPQCGLKPSHAPCFEKYTEAFNPHTGLGGMEIWVPLEA
ncbi:MAG TPA: GyrI-like domain-containing protein [Planctomycetaceae bacterium]|nr:GyrI-like domain-containing protein [Planctomycetaceae bacterium]